MPAGKRAGERCIQLDAADRCRLFGLPSRPAVCISLRPAVEMCGPDRAHAVRWLSRLERATAPAAIAAAPRC